MTLFCLFGSRKNHLLALALLGLGADRIASAQQPFSQPEAADSTGIVATPAADLRWTPHRSATAPRPDALTSPIQESISAATALAAPLAQGGPSPQNAAIAAPSNAISPPSAPAWSAPVAAVTLPPGVPVIAPPPAGANGLNSFAPLRNSFNAGLSDWVSNNRIAGGFPAPSTTDGTPTILGTSLLRAPQGNHGRPIMTPEGTTRRPPTTPPDSQRAGGMAPRYSPSAQNSPTQNMARMAPPRRERLAMNVDGIPSVMTRNPQADAIDNTSPPARLPGANQPQSSETLPLPPDRTGPQPTIETTEPSPGMEMLIDPMQMEAQGQMSEGLDGQIMMPSDPMSNQNSGLWMGNYPAELHVESFYDDPYACEDELGCFPMWQAEGRICAYLRSFGRPYYGWKWYRDFTASGGITSFQNETNLGLHGNYGTNEYANWAMPFWNAFGIGWQLGVRGVQSNFQTTTLEIPGQTSKLSTNSRNQVFVTTGFFTRAFEGRGLQGGAVYDYLRDDWYDNVDASQVRGELSYVWGYHELGFWGAGNVADTNGIFSSSSSTTGSASTLDLYTAFYRLHFGDANEWKVWGGATGGSNGIVGSAIRAPMSRSLAMEGTFTYVIPSDTQTTTIDKATITHTSSAWNLSLNLVYYPAGRSRRSLASPYRPLFDVADNGSMIRSIAPFSTPTP
ncbi:MAG: DUF6666 family protein [Planctomycetota bacterium]